MLLSSVFGKPRRKVQKKLSELTSVRHTVSPPSPESFVSPEIVEINDSRSLSYNFGSDPFQSYYESSRSSSPRVQLDLGPTGSISEWFPTGLLANEPRPSSERNASGSTSGSTRRPVITGSASSEVLDISSDNLVDQYARWEESSRPSIDTDYYNDQISNSYSEISVSSQNTTPRKQAPAPIRIPQNPTAVKIKVKRSPSPLEEQSAEQHSRTFAADSAASAPSRPPSSSGSALDEASAVSGTTLARALVAGSWIYTPDSRASRYRSGAQDSATLPRRDSQPPSSSGGERPDSGIRPSFTSRPPSVFRPSSIPPVPPLPLNPESMLSPDHSSTRHQISAAVLNRKNSQELPYAPDALRCPPTSARLQVDQTRLPPISPITEANSPTPSTLDTPVVVEESPSPDEPALASSSAEQHTTNSGSPELLRVSQHLNEPSSCSEGGHTDSGFGTEIDDGDANRSTKPPSLVDISTTPDSASEFPSNFVQQSPEYTPTTGSAYSVSSFGKSSILSSTPGTSIRSSNSARNHPVSPKALMPRSRSGSDIPRLAGSSRPSVLLPIGERPLSVQVPGSGSSLASAPAAGSRSRSHSNASTVPASARLPEEPSVDSPDWLDSMFPPSGSDVARERPIRPPPPPISLLEDIPSPLLQSSSADSESSASAGRQTFPETPYEFSPLFSAKGQYPGLPTARPATLESASALQRAALANRSGARDMKRSTSQRVFRSATFSVFSPAGRSPRVPLTPPPSAENMNIPTDESNGTESTQKSEQNKRLSAIQEARMSVVPGSSSVSRRSSKRSSGSSLYTNTTPPLANSSEVLPKTDTEPDTEPRPSSSTYNAASRQSVSPLRSPPPSYMPTSSSNASPRTFLDHESEASVYSRRSSLHSQSEVSPNSRRSSLVPQKRPLSPLPTPPPTVGHVPSQPDPLSVPDTAMALTGRHSPPPPYAPELIETARSPSPKTPSKESPAASTSDVSSTPAKRLTRIRPPLPLGPRMPSVSMSSNRGSTMTSARPRGSSISSMNSTPGGRLARKASTVTLTGASPKFQGTPVRFRGMTMEAAQWTFTSHELQEVVSNAIKQSANPAAIRLLPLQTLETALPEEMARLQALSHELRTTYKLNVRRRKVLIRTLKSISEDSECHDPMAAARTLEDLSEITEDLDQLSEELYVVTDQLKQLTHLQDIHLSSALAMALRKLNTGFLKQAAETERLRVQVETMEAERNEAWEKAQEVAQEFDDFADLMSDVVSPSVDASRRSSRISVARRNSVRASKAGLRSTSRRRSTQSISSSVRNSTVLSPRATDDEIPPVPPIPLRTPLGVLTYDFSARASSAGFTSESPSGEMRAMVQAQKELCEMLGISMDELKGQAPVRRRSTSAVIGSPVSKDIAQTRPSSEVLTPPPTQKEWPL